MPIYTVNALSELLGERKIQLEDATIALLGLSDDEGEEGVGTRIMEALEKRAAQVRAYDPSIARTRLDLKQTLQGAHAAVIASDLPIFRNLSPRQFEELGVLVVVDARNRLDREAFADSAVAYRGIGRG